MVKEKTPTMGGIVFMFSTIVASLLTIKFSNLYAVGAIITLLLFALIGFWDDFAKIKHHENLAGFKARTKLALQIISAILISCFLYTVTNFDTSKRREVQRGDRSHASIVGNVYL